MDEFAERVQHLAEEHLDACYDAMYADSDGEEVESPAFGPFCGCATCVVREVLSVTWTHMLAEAKREAANA